MPATVMVWVRAGLATAARRPSNDRDPPRPGPSTAGRSRADPVVDDLARTLDRYGTYGPRLRRAVARVEAGEGDWFTKPSLPSYHTVWFELHEDLIRLAGRTRAEELEPGRSD